MAWFLTTEITKNAKKLLNELGLQGQADADRHCAHAGGRPAVRLSEAIFED